MSNGNNCDAGRCEGDKKKLIIIVMDNDWLTAFPNNNQKLTKLFD